MEMFVETEARKMTIAATHTELQQHLSSLGACADAREWAAERTAQQAWEDCERPDWLLWWIVRARRDLRPRVVRLLVRELRARTLDRCRAVDRSVCAAALDAAERWVIGPSPSNAAAARSAAAAASDAAYAAASAAAARSAAAAASDAAYAAASDAAYAAAAAASSASDAAYAAADASDAAYAAAAAASSASDAEESAAWLIMIRAEFGCPPWVEAEAVTR